MELKQQNFITHASRSLLWIRFVAVPFRSEEVFEERGPRDLFCPALDPILGRYGQTSLCMCWAMSTSSKEIWFVAVAFQSEEEISWKRGTPMTYFGPALDPPLGGSGLKTTLVRDHEFFIPTKFHQNPSSGSGEEVENVKRLRMDDGRRRTVGRRTVRYDNSSLEPSAQVSW